MAVHTVFAVSRGVACDKAPEGVAAVELGASRDRRGGDRLCRARGAIRRGIKRT